MIGLTQVTLPSRSAFSVTEEPHSLIRTKAKLGPPNPGSVVIDGEGAVED